jgi:hypothetical protein
VVRVRLEVGNEQTQARMRTLQLLAKGAIVTRLVLDGGKPPHFAERLEPDRDDDSGWAFSSGRETQAYLDDARNLQLVSLGGLVEKHPALRAIIDAPVGSLFRLDGERYVPDER